MRGASAASSCAFDASTSSCLCTTSLHLLMCRLVRAVAVLMLMQTVLHSRSQLLSTRCCSLDEGGTDNSLIERKRIVCN